MKIKTILLILGLLVTNIQQSYAAAEVEEADHRRGPSLCLRLAMAGTALFAIASGSYYASAIDRPAAHSPALDPLEEGYGSMETLGCTKLDPFTGRSPRFEWPKSMPVPIESVRYDEFLKEAADGGDVRAKRDWAIFKLLVGGSSRSEKEEAVQLLEEAVGAGERTAHYDLALAYLNGDLVEKDVDRAIDLLTPIAEEGDERAEFSLANIYSGAYGEEYLDHTLGFSWFLRSARKEFSEAEYNVGAAYINGIGVDKDEEIGMLWVKRAAKHCHPQAQHAYGRYIYEEKVESDSKLEESMIWYERAVEKGYEPAIEIVGDRYYIGRGVTQDYKKAKSYYDRIKDTSATAQFRLAIIYFNGKIGKPNRRLGEGFLRKSAAQGYQHAIDTLKRLEDSRKGKLDKDEL